MLAEKPYTICFDVDCKLQSDESIGRVGEVFPVRWRNVETSALVSAVSISGCLACSLVTLGYTSLFISPGMSLVFITLTLFLDFCKLLVTLRAPFFPSAYCHLLSTLLFLKWSFTTRLLLFWISKSGSPHWFGKMTDLALIKTSAVTGIPPGGVGRIATASFITHSHCFCHLLGISFLIPFPFHFSTNYLSASLNF